ncbi:MAG: hypothetical protein JNL13_11015 [Chitinophagaceae bacterium]|nr:hypothetical protein [Chitinophagaceae bacterium]
MKKIKVGYCVAYDWEMLRYSLPQVYQGADEVCLALDKNLVSWTGNPFDMDEEAFLQFVREIDTANKIKVYRDNFFIRELSPMQNEVRQRNMIASFMKDAQEAWYIQLDADEYFLNFASFLRHLGQLKPKRNINVCVPFLILFKQVHEGFLYISNDSLSKQEMIPVATNNPHYEFGRKNGYFNVITNDTVIHQSWARSSEEIRLKLSNWGHNTDFDVQEYYKTWEQLSGNNYTSFRNFHPFKASEWEKLRLLKAGSIEELVQQYKEEDFFNISKLRILLKNSIWFSRLKKLLGR